MALVTAVGADSPWSKTVQARMDSQPPAVYFPRDAGGKIHQFPVGPEPSPSNSQFAFYGKVNVIWASAAPTREALHQEIPLNPEDHYVIGVSGLPSVVLNDILAHGVATLAVKHVGEIKADSARVTSDQRMVLFAFPRAKLLISKDPVTFRLRDREMTIQAGFEPKQMRYQGRLAL
jgi:hypothetical protein